MARKKRRKSKTKQIPAHELEATQTQYSNPGNGLAELFNFLDSCRDFPVKVKTASVNSGIPEEEVIMIINGSLYYFVWRDEITAIRSA